MQQVTSSPREEASPLWSPDGRALTYNIFAEPGGICVVRRGQDGAWGKLLQRTSSGLYPAWSPDGHWIAYTDNYLFGGSLMIVSPDSRAPRFVLDSAKSNGVYAENPVWSTDSRTIYFKSHDPKGNASFWSIPITGGQPTLLTRLTDPDRPSYRPEWSVGAGRMYFTINDRQSDVWVMDVTP